MKKHITDEKNRYFLHTSRRLLLARCLLLPAEEEIPIGVRGGRHKQFLKNHQRGVYNKFLVSGKLQTYLAQIDRDAQEMFDLLVRQLAKQEDVTEQLKAVNQMEWLQRMNSIRNRATEIVNKELIFV